MADIELTAQGETYRIVAEPGLIERAGDYFGGYRGKKAAVITDENVHKLYGKALVSSLRAAGLEPVELVVPAGEESKRHEILLTLYGDLYANGVTRGDCIVALGGGVVGDLAGYAAATYLRGVPLIQIPTTLLAQVDSSVGGKVAVNLPQGKNLVGTFCQPSLVLADADALGTLDARQLGAGLAEIVKYGAIADAPLLALLQNGRPDARALADLVLRCCAIKARYVQADPFDKGVRMALNFGHTLGHTIEAVCGYGTVLHGEAVAIGMVAAARWGEELGITPCGTADSLRSLLIALDLPADTPHGKLEALIARVSGDKKADGRDITVVLLKQMGECLLQKLPVSDLCDLIRRCA